MDEKEFNPEDKMEKLEITKELQTLKDLSMEALNNIESEYQTDFDKHMEDSDLIFQTEVETKEEVKQEIEEEKKENIFKRGKKKWNGLEKKKKIIIIISIVIILFLIVALVIFLCLNHEEEEVKPKDPDVILGFDNYRYENGTLVFLDDEKEIGRYECENKDENLCQVAYSNLDNTMDTTKRVDENGESLTLRTKIYYENYVFVMDTKSENTSTIYLYDIKNQKKLQTVFEVLQTYDYEDYVILKNEESKYGVIKISENDVSTVIPYSYDEVHLIPNQTEMKLISVRKDNNSYIADTENKILTKAFNTTIVNATENYVVTKDSSSKYHIYDYNAKEINADISHDYIAVLDKIMISVQENKLYILDSDGNLYSAQDFSLKNTNYNPVATYKELKLEKTEQAFDYELNNNILNINIYDGEEKTNYNVNLNEGKLSSTISFLSYFEGSLYFYEDSAKTKLIGSYSCTNRNTVEDNTTELTSCKVASDSIYRETTGNMKEVGEVTTGMIPIIGKKYVFISDGDTILLVDLTKNSDSVIAKYTNVDTASYTGGNEISFASPTSMPFIAKSKTSGKFGVAKITSDGVLPVIAFDKTSIKKLGDYYVVEEDGKYSLYSLEGEKVTEDKNSPIVDYYKTYLKTYKDNMYFVHTFSSDVSSTAYNYIELYDEYYAAVMNNRVHLYRYDDAETEYLTDGEESGIELKITDYYGKDVNAFRITFDSKNIYVEIGNTNNTYSSKKTFPIAMEKEEEEEPTEDD